MLIDGYEVSIFHDWTDMRAQCLAYVSSARHGLPCWIPRVPEHMPLRAIRKNFTLFTHPIEFKREKCDSCSGFEDAFYVLQAYDSDINSDPPYREVITGPVPELGIGLRALGWENPGRFGALYDEFRLGLL